MLQIDGTIKKAFTVIIVLFGVDTRTFTRS